MNIKNILKLINQGETVIDKVKIIFYLIKQNNEYTIKMIGPKGTRFFGIKGFNYTVWHNFIDYDKKVFEYIENNNFDVFIDIGANFGKYSIILGKINPSAVLLAFEPIKRNRDIFEQNCKENSISPIIKDVALSDKIGSASLFLAPEGKEGSHSLVENYTNGAAIVKTDLLDNYRSFFTNNTLIKIDVEGAELKVLFGGKNVIKKFKPTILFESHTQKELEDISLLLEPIGYVIRNIEDVNYVAVVE